jgi:putative cardiolipin synthase
LDWRQESILQTLEKEQTRLIWAAAEVVSDAPDKAWVQAERGKSKSEIVNRMATVMGEAEREIMVVSPYLILSKESAQGLSQYTKRGVSVNILTNSLRSTDALPVVAMYRPVREDILGSGVRLFEMRPDAASRERHVDPSRKNSRLSLHAKTVVLDRRTVFVGTFNVDPRSEHLNTEVGLLVRSEELAHAVAEALDEDLKLENAYELTLTDRGEVEWTSSEKGKKKVYTGDPHAGFWRRTAAFFLSLLPIRGQL